MLKERANRIIKEVAPGLGFSRVEIMGVTGNDTARDPWRVKDFVIAALESSDSKMQEQQAKVRERTKEKVLDAIEGVFDKFGDPKGLLKRIMMLNTVATVFDDVQSEDAPKSRRTDRRG